MGFKKDWYGANEHSAGAAHTGPTELSWGPGLVAPGKEYAPPSEDGFYRGRSPSMVDPPRRRDVPGYPGERVAQ